VSNAPIPRVQALSLRAAAAVGTVVILLSACGPRASFQPVERAAPAPTGENTGGDAVAPAVGVPGNERYLYRRDQPDVAVQNRTTRMMGRLPAVIGVTVTPLESTEDTVAVMMVEDAPDTDWGVLLDQVKPELFTQFAGDGGFGDWLILVTDVVVHAPEDPVPPTAYRWSREEVEEFVGCGVPQSGQNDCSRAFFQAADTVLLVVPGAPGRGR
jgi:hypothetical protein